MTTNLFVNPIAFQPGEGTGVVVAPGTFKGSTAVYTTATGPTDLDAVFIPAKALAQDGDWLQFSAWGTYRPDKYTSFKVMLNGLDLISLVGPGTLGSTKQWSLNGTLLRKSSTGAELQYVAYLNDTTPAIIFGTLAPTTGLDWAATQTLKVRAETSDSAYPITQRAFLVTLGNRP